MNIGGEGRGGNNEGGGEFTSKNDTQLTACKTSLFFVGDGFNVYDCRGQLIFRVDSYDPEWGDQVELVLMDASGRCLLTVRRKWASLHKRWEGYRGEKTNRLKPIFSVKRSSMVGKSEVTVEMYENEEEEYQIDGSFADRNCTIYDAKSREIMVEIRRKVDIGSNMVVGKDAFSILIKPGFDYAFAMGLVLILDQINADDELPDGLPDGFPGELVNGLANVIDSSDIHNGFSAESTSSTVAL